MITNTGIDELLARAEPRHRFDLQRLVDRISFAEGGGIRRDLCFLVEARGYSTAFCGIPVNELTRDELIAIIDHMTKRDDDRWRREGAKFSRL